LAYPQDAARLEANRISRIHKLVTGWQLLAERGEMDDIVCAIEKIHEHLLDFKPAAV
jgi:hypothetical protein